MLTETYIFFGILEFHLSLEFTLTFNRCYYTKNEILNSTPI